MLSTNRLGEIAKADEGKPQGSSPLRKSSSAKGRKGSKPVTDRQNRREAKLQLTRIASSSSEQVVASPVQASDVALAERTKKCGEASASLLPRLLQKVHDFATALSSVALDGKY